MKSIEYIKSLKWYMIAVTAVFILMFIAGAVYSEQYPEKSKAYLDQVKKEMTWITELSPIETFLFIFANNAGKSIIALFLGIGFGAIPILFIASNGVIIGMVVDTISREQGTVFVVSALLPHGIIEIPMVLISAAIGLKLGIMTISWSTKTILFSAKISTEDIRSELNQGFKTFATLIMPLLFAASVIETFITPVIASYFIR